MRKAKALFWALSATVLLAATVFAATADAKSGRYLFLTADLNQPLPGTNYTAEDFTDLGIELFDSWSALLSEMTDDVCWVGTLGSVDREVDLWLRNPNNTARIVTYRVDENRQLQYHLFGIHVKVQYWVLNHLVDFLERYPCDEITKQIEQLIVQKVEQEAFLAMVMPQRNGHGGVFMVENLAEPIPGAPYTVEDFAAANIRLLTPYESLFSALTDDICMVGGTHELLDLRLSGSMELGEYIIASNYHLFAVDPELELFIHYPAQYLLHHDYIPIFGLTREVPSLRNQDGTWRSLHDIMEEVGCPTEPPQAAPEQQRHEPKKYGGIFVSDDLLEPIPGAPYTRHDFLAAGIEVVPAPLASMLPVPDDICIVGGLLVELDKLAQQPQWGVDLLSGRFLLFVVDPYHKENNEEYFTGSLVELYVMTNLDDPAPSLRNPDGSWRTIASIVEEAGCAIQPLEPEMESSAPAAWEYRVITVQELLEGSAGQIMASVATGMERALNRYGAEGWELVMQLGDLLVFKRPAS